MLLFEPTTGAFPYIFYESFIVIFYESFYIDIFCYIHFKYIQSVERGGRRLFQGVVDTVDMRVMDLSLNKN